MTKGFYNDKDIRRDGLLKLPKLRERDKLAKAPKTMAEARAETERDLSIVNLAMHLLMKKFEKLRRQEKKLLNRLEFLTPPAPHRITWNCGSCKVEVPKGDRCPHCGKTRQMKK